MNDLEKALFGKNDNLHDLYASRVIELIHLKYPADNESALLRKIVFGELSKDSTEAQAYNTYVNECKTKAHAEVYGS